MLVMALAFGMTVVGCEDEPEPDVTVTFDAGMGTWDDGSSIKSVKVAHGTSTINGRDLIKDPTMKDHKLIDWVPHPNPDPIPAFYTIPSPLRRDLTLYARWQKIEE